MEIILSQDASNDCLRDKDTFGNERIRPDNVSFWDAMLSKEADLTATLEGRQIIETIKAL